MSTPETCPHCSSDLRGEPIPEKARGCFGNATHFSRAITIQYRGEDYARDWRCPDCGHTWRRR